MSSNRNILLGRPGRGRRGLGVLVRPSDRDVEAKQAWLDACAVLGRAIAVCATVNPEVADDAERALIHAQVVSSDAGWRRPTLGLRIGEESDPWLYDTDSLDAGDGYGEDDAA